MKKKYQKYNFKTISIVLNNSIIHSAEDLNGYKHKKFPIKIQIAIGIILVISNLHFNRDSIYLKANRNFHLRDKNIDSKHIKKEIKEFYDYIYQIKKLTTDYYVNLSNTKLSSNKNNAIEILNRSRNNNFQLVPENLLKVEFKDLEDYTQKFYGFKTNSNFFNFIMYITGTIKDGMACKDKSKKDVFDIKPVMYNRISSNESYYYFFDNDYNLKEAAKKSNISLQKLKKIEKTLFLDINNNSNKNYLNNPLPNDFYKNFSKFIGIKSNNNYFIPKNYYILLSFFKYVVKQKNNLNNKKEQYGPIFESLVLKKFKLLFDSLNIKYKYFFNYNRRYTEHGEKKSDEKDILFEFDGYSLIIECKTNIKNNSNGEFVKKAIHQAETSKNHILNNGKFTDNSGQPIKIMHNNENKIYKIIVTLDDLYFISIDPKKILDVSKQDMFNTYIIDYFNLNMIFWIIQFENLKIKTFLNFIRRKDTIIKELNKYISSMNIKKDDIYNSYSPYILDYFIYYVNKKNIKNMKGKEFIEFIKHLSDYYYDAYDEYYRHPKYYKYYKYYNHYN